MELILIPGKGRYKDLPFYVRNNHAVYMLDSPGHHGDIIAWMKDNDIIEGFDDGLMVGGQFFFEGDELTYTLFGYEDHDIESWCQSMIPKLIEQGATHDSFHDGTFHYTKLPASLAMEKMAFRWDPSFYLKAGLPVKGCFGCLDGHLMLGIKHHQLIMAALIKKGWTFGQMMKPHQSWGWFNIVNPEQLMKNDPWFASQLQYDEYSQSTYFYQGLPKGHSARTWPFLNIQFSSDAGVMDRVGVDQTKQAFQNMYRLPVQLGQTEDFGGLQDPENYGKGLAGATNINRYLDENQPDYYKMTDNVQNVPDPPEPEPWSDEQAERLRVLQNKQQKAQQSYGTPLTVPEENELLQLWIAQQENSMKSPVVSKLSSQSYKFLWADGIFEVSKGFFKDQHHYSLLKSAIDKLGRVPTNYVAGDFTQDPFHPAYGALTIRWHQGQNPPPEDLKEMMQRYITQSV